MKNYLLFFSIILISLTTSSCSHSQPSCDLWYGTDTDRLAIQDAMFNGTVEDVTSAINIAKNSRGPMVGCPQEDYSPRTLGDTTKPNIEEIEALWLGQYEPGIMAYELNCPEVARGMPSLGLGALYAKQAGYFRDEQSLEKMAKMLMSTQYNKGNAHEPLVAAPGLYAYFNPESTEDDCTLPGLAGSATAGFCELAPELCPTYNNGLFSGKSFAVIDHKITNGIVVGDIGGAGYDQGWAGTFMLECLLQLGNNDLKEDILKSVLEAGEWSIQHPLVTNHNYTSKLIWFLAQLYSYTGREDFKNALIDKLDRNLVPGVLMDFNNDGLVDGMNPPVAFKDLSDIAQLPGRNWDGHNALPWYHSMNTWAMLEAYVAFRDMGDEALAEKYRPYAIAMIDNLSHEMVDLGVPSNSGAGARDFPMSILLGIWKIVQYEKEPHPIWEQAAWAIWNSGVFTSSLGEKGLNLPLYLLILKEVPYIPINGRVQVINKLDASAVDNDILLFPNPAESTTGFKIPSNLKSQSIKLDLYDMAGKKLDFDWYQKNDNIILDIGKLPSGVVNFVLTAESNRWISTFIKD